MGGIGHVDFPLLPGRGDGAVTEQVEQMDEASAAVLMKNELLAGETLIRSVGANVLLPLHPDAGGKGAKPYVLGASAPRKVLGMLHLTNYRLKFKPADRTEPDFTILLPAIAQVRDVSFLFVRKFRLTMQDGTFIEFLKWGIPSFIASLNITRGKAGNLDWDTIRRDMADAPDKLGAWSVLPA
jgi:hypothetical protein